MAKNKISAGRPKGTPKKALNIFLPLIKIKDLRGLAKKENRTISSVVELALDPMLIRGTTSSAFMQDNRTGTANPITVTLK